MGTWTSDYEKERAWRPGVAGSFNLVQGYAVHYASNLAYATVRGAGHMTPTFRPEASHTMARRFVAQTGSSRPY